MTDDLDDLHSITMHARGSMHGKMRTMMVNILQRSVWQAVEVSCSYVLGNTQLSAYHVRGMQCIMLLRMARRC